MKDNFPFLNKPSDDKSMDYFVRAMCDSGDLSCVNSPVGGDFNSTARVRLSLGAYAERDAVVMRYTLDGSDVTEASSVYDDDVGIITKTTQISARAFPIDRLFTFTTGVMTRPLFTFVDGDVSRSEET